MSKLFLISSSAVGGVIVVGGGVLAVKSSLFKNAVNPQKRETFRERYKHAILSDTDDLWNEKFNIIKGDGKPIHLTLKSAKDNSEAKETEAKGLHKQGCREIYDSKVEGTNYLDDFQSYCSKNLGDEITSPKVWIADDNTQGDKWNTKLANLKDHDVNQNKKLDSVLETLKITLSSVENSNWTNEHRKSLKDWCDVSKKEIFLGHWDPRFIHVGLYCIEN